ncbi:MAG: histidine phosphatase family protein [Actinomycetota bacterium]|jgi:8-oxo-dGTP diphosphatase|nr:histidine phosphatase family protein [Euzebyaceae bacterium]MDQ3452069.1 histidine phosphatase family protein [Actinomycetota bacterium]
MGTILLVRHAHAGNSDAWVGDDRIRPLSPKGVRQSRGLVKLLDDRPIGTIHSSPFVRCTQTVEPLAAARGLAVLPMQALAEGSGDAALRLVRDLAEGDATLCTHGDIIPLVLQGLGDEGLALPRNARWQKGSVWVLRADGEGCWQAAYLPPAA